ncbi:trehalose operon repressor [Brevibacillus fulvus]|uniref:Trehalose operon repressor n=1 Tax=Brevibacillus fulvus TaxID=1125967 RepID=A0A939BW29_9BACL|nr:trehalose operon repressor [Brevibacillus fulvus]MBM7591361.1 GntR family trehalose operon transcriptional repressor [Brevibacillus fulvus]
MTKRYREIYEDLKNSILEGTVSPGEKLPSETDLCKRYGASRGTVRRALELLAKEGFVYSLHGKGVFVLENDLISFSVGGLVSFKEAAQASGKAFSTVVSRFAEVTIDEPLQKKTNLPLGKTAYQLFRVRKLEGENIILDINYFLKELVPGLTEEIAAASIYEYIEETLNQKIGFAKRVIQVEKATRTDKEQLDVKQYNLMAVVKNFVYLYDGTQFEYTESRHRPDRFIFTDFARRR